MTYARIKHVILAVLILMSLYLTINIWMPVPVRVDEDSSDSQTGSQQPSSLVERDTNEVYSPHQVILHAGAASHAFNPSAFTELYANLIETMQFEDLSIGEDFTEAEYQEYFLEKDRPLELVYPGPLPFGLFADNFNNIPTDLANTEFDRIFIDIEDQDHIYFYNSSTDILNEVEVIDFDLSGLDDLLTEENHLYNVYLQSVQNKFIYLPSTPVNLEASHHVVERLPNNLYSTHFFPDPSGVELRVSNNISRYIDLTTELRINNVTNVLTYYRQLSDLNELTRTERFQMSRDELNILENWTNEVRYIGTNEQMKQVNFRRFYNGWPIFSEGEHFTITEVGVLEDGLSHLKLPLLILQTPISMDEDTTVELASGVNVVNALSTVMDVSEIQDLTIGLKWMDTDESSQVVHFEPGWFVKTNNSWTAVDSLLEEGGSD